MPFQQLMSVLPPVSSVEAGIPKMMVELMKQPFSPLVDFYPVDFGLDLNGKRFTWMAVILLPFIDEPRLVRVLAPIFKQLTAEEKVRNRRGQEVIFGHRDDKSLFHSINLAQAAFEAGHAGMKQTVKDPGYLLGTIEGCQSGGAGRTVCSPIEGLPDVEESHCISAVFYDPEAGRHVAKMLDGVEGQLMVVNASDMDEGARMKGFGGEAAQRMILQALGKDPKSRPKYKDLNREVPKASPAQADSGHWGDNAYSVEAEAEAGSAGSAPAPPAGTKVIRMHEKKGQANGPDAPDGFSAVRRNKGKGGNGRSAPF